MMAAERREQRGPVDWVEIRRRVDAAGRAISGHVELSPEEARRVLEERARALARPLTPRSAEDLIEVVSFALSGETYAIESRYVVEIFPLRGLALLPGAEPPLVGVTAWRGELLTIFDLRRMTGAPAQALSDLGRVIVLGEEAPAFGILADAVEELTTLPASAIHPPAGGIAEKREFVRGVTREAMLLVEAKDLILFYT